MSTWQKAERRRPSKGTRRFGYGISIVVQVALLILVNNLVAWDIAPFITDEFNDLVPYINVSLAASMVVNAVYFAFDARWFKSFTQAMLARTGLVVLMVLVGIGIIGEVVKMVQALSTEGTTHRQPPPAAV